MVDFPALSANQEHALSRISKPPAQGCLASLSPLPCRPEVQQEVQGEESSWFAQLRALVSCSAASGTFVELALVRWYQAVEPEDEEAELGMQKVQWVTVGKGRSLSKERYDLSDIRTIQKAIFSQPHPHEPETWFYNHFV